MHSSAGAIAIILLFKLLHLVPFHLERHQLFQPFSFNGTQQILPLFQKSKTQNSLSLSAKIDINNQENETKISKLRQRQYSLKHSAPCKGIHNSQQDLGFCLKFPFYSLLTSQLSCEER